MIVFLVVGTIKNPIPPLLLGGTSSHLLPLPLANVRYGRDRSRCCRPTHRRDQRRRASQLRLCACGCSQKPDASHVVDILTAKQKKVLSSSHRTLSLTRSTSSDGVGVTDNADVILLPSHIQLSTPSFSSNFLGGKIQMSIASAVSMIHYVQHDLGRRAERRQLLRSNPACACLLICCVTV